MSNTWQQRVSLDQFTVQDWIEAQHHLSANRFGIMKRVARKGGIYIPAMVMGRNSQPRATFEFDAGLTAQHIRIEDSPRLRKFNQDVAQWGERVAFELRSNVAGLFHDHGPAAQRLATSIESYVAYDKHFHMEVYRVGFRFARHGVHLHFGAFRGHGGNKGSRWMDRLGNIRETNPDSLGKMGTGARAEADWFNPILTKHLKELADIAADYCADMTVNTEYLFLG